MLSRFHLILSTQRTGSTMLARLIDTIPGVTNAGEVFRHGERPNIGHPDLAFSSWLRNQYRFASLPSARTYDRYFSFLNDHAVQAVGVKVMLNQLRGRPLLWRSIVRVQPNGIALRRENLFRQHISVLRARETRNWSPDRPRSDAKIHVPAGSLLADLAQLARADAKLLAKARRLGFPIVAYEDLVGESKNATLETCFHAIGVAVTDVAGYADRIQNRARPLEQLVLNFDECMRILVGSAYQLFLDD